MEVLGSVHSESSAPGSPGSSLEPSLFITSLSLTSARRITGFRLSLGLLALLTVLGTLGIASSFLDEYLDFSVAKKLRHF